MLSGVTWGCVCVLDMAMSVADITTIHFYVEKKFFLLNICIPDELLTSYDVNL